MKENKKENNKTKFWLFNYFYLAHYIYLDSNNNINQVGREICINQRIKHDDLPTLVKQTQMELNAGACTIVSISYVNREFVLFKQLKEKLRVIYAGK